MSHESRPRILNREIYLAALEISHLEERQAYLNDACVGDAARRAKINQLLAAHAIEQKNPLDVAVDQQFEDRTASATHKTTFNHNSAEKRQ